MGPRSWRKPVLPHNLPVKQRRNQRFLLSLEKWSRSRSRTGMWDVCLFAPEAGNFTRDNCGEMVGREISHKLIYLHNPKEEERNKNQIKFWWHQNQSEMFNNLSACFSPSSSAQWLISGPVHQSDQQTRKATGLILQRHPAPRGVGSNRHPALIVLPQEPELILFQRKSAKTFSGVKLKLQLKY